LYLIRVIGEMIFVPVHCQKNRIILSSSRKSERELGWSMKILVITPRGFHLGYLGCYGNAWIVAPCLDTFASESVVFDHHYSDCPSPVGAWRAWRTGCYNFPTPGNESISLPLASCDILSVLRAGNMPSILITDSPEVHDPNDSRAWQEVHAISAGKAKESYWKESWKAVSESIRQLDSHEHGLLWLETSFLIPPWTVDASGCDDLSAEIDEESPEETIEPLLHPTMGLLDPSEESTFLRLQRTYAAAVSRLDRELGELWRRLRRDDIYDSLMIILTTDRGFPLGEHGLVGDSQPWLYEELVHLPLMVRLPNGANAGQRIGTLTQSVDLMPTLLEAFSLSFPETHGSSLLPLIRGEQERIRDHACSGLLRGTATEYALRTQDWAFLLPEDTRPGDAYPPLRDRQLYVKPEDRWEVNNVLQHYPELVEQLEETLRALVKAPPRSPGVATPGLPNR
jgi:arylsulfatase A-like enzyme